VKGSLPHLEPVLEKMEANSREMVNTMSDIVWTINPRNDAGEKLADRIEAYAKDMSAINEIGLEFTVDENIRNLKLPLEYRKNIYLIFKEAFTNALKYSKASVIRIDLSVKRGLLKIYIKDNGKGFVDSQAYNGNGLKNMRSRAEKIRADLAIRSNPGEGTEIILQSQVT
jgi:signal transduction histidine kinase